MLRAIHEMAWATRMFYTLLYVAAGVNAIMAFAPRIKPHWRFIFGYTATVLGIYGFYLAMRIVGVFDRYDYALLVRWLLPLLVFPMIMPPLAIHWESKYYKQALTKLVDDSGEHDFK